MLVLRSLLVARPRVWLVAAAAVPLLGLALARWRVPGPPRFANVHELKAWAEAGGLYCHSDRKDGQVWAALAVSTRPLTWQEVGRLGALHRPGRQAGWAGIVWAINRGPSVDSLRAPPWYGECRSWGGVLVTGDPALLDRIEAGPSPGQRGAP